MEKDSLLKALAGRFAQGPAQAMLDRGVAQSATAAAMCARLDGKTLQIHPGSAALAVHFVVIDQRLKIRPGIVADADATLSGTPVNLARLSGDNPAAVIRDGAVQVSGDTDIADQFRYLLEQVQPDWEELLSRATGDVVAHEIGSVARGLSRWATKARSSLARSAGEYLTEETAALATPVEVEEFCRDVDELAAATDRLEARLRLFSESNTVEE